MEPGNPDELLRSRLDHPHHRRVLLGESAIDPKVVVGRGYFTAKSKNELGRLGFASPQRLTPTLVIPMYSPTGELITHQIRSDTPREVDGKRVKYETPAGSSVHLDVHPSQTVRVRDASIPLWITEGVKKADSLVSQGQCAVALQGVWCWQKEGVLLPEWEEIRLWGRSVFVAFDSDVTVKISVQAALEGLVGFLRSRGARVRVHARCSFPAFVPFLESLSSNSSKASMTTLCPRLPAPAGVRPARSRACGQ